jgi:hypothetical protein
MCVTQGYAQTTKRLVIASRREGSQGRRGAEEEPHARRASEPLSHHR